LSIVDEIAVDDIAIDGPFKNETPFSRILRNNLNAILEK
jgi:hypothetical protein